MKNSYSSIMIAIILILVPSSFSAAPVQNGDLWTGSINLGYSEINMTEVTFDYVYEVNDALIGKDVNTYKQQYEMWMNLLLYDEDEAIITLDVNNPEHIGYFGCLCSLYFSEDIIYEFEDSTSDINDHFILTAQLSRAYDNPNPLNVTTMIGMDIDTPADLTSDYTLQFSHSIGIAHNNETKMKTLGTYLHEVDFLTSHGPADGRILSFPWEITLIALFSFLSIRSKMKNLPHKI